MKKQNFRKVLNLKKQSISDLNRDFIKGAAAEGGGSTDVPDSTRGHFTCKNTCGLSCPGECDTGMTLTECNDCNSFAC
jgi:hypothetical protein